MTQTEHATPTLPAVAPLDASREVEALAARYLGAQGVLMHLVTVAGGQIEGAMARLPQEVQMRIERAVGAALRTSYDAARATRVGPATGLRGGDRAHRAAAVALGFAGGFGGLPTALAELPFTITAMLRSIQEIAASYGEDPTDEATRIECLRVLGAGGPMSDDDGADLAFFGARLTLTGAALNRLIAQIAPRFAAVIGPKLAAQTVPVLGAVAGAGTNLAFTRYYQEMAHVHFALRRLEREGHPEAPLAFRGRVAASREQAGGR